jgi:RecA/RadA recombinase
MLITSETTVEEIQAMREAIAQEEANMTIEKAEALYNKGEMGRDELEDVKTLRSEALTKFNSLDAVSQTVVLITCNINNHLEIDVTDINTTLLQKYLHQLTNKKLAVFSSYVNYRAKRSKHKSMRR